MQGNFEKQVQDKMDGLKLPPSPPVWENIESAIKQQRRRRMPLLWLFLVVLLTTAGLIYYSDNKINSNLEKEKITKAQEPHSRAKQIDSASSETVNPVSHENSKTENSENNKTSKTAESLVNSDEVLIKKVLQKVSRKKLPDKTSKGIYETDIESAKPDVVQEKISTDLQTDNTSSNTLSQKTTNDKKVVLSDSLPPVVAKSTEKKSNRNSKWQIGLTADIGLAGISKETSQNGIQVTTGGLPGPTYPRKSSNGLHYSLGLRLTKKLDDRLSISTGVSYSVFNTFINAGDKVNGDTVLSSMRVNGFYPSTSSAKFKNTYRFISIPVQLNYQVLPKHPLMIHAGISLNQFVGTGPLQYDRNSGLYFENNAGLSKTQVFTNLGLSYRLFSTKKSQIFFGPQVQYGLTKLQKNGSNDRLFSYGLKLYTVSKKNK